MAPIAREIGVKVTEAGTRDVPLLDEKAVLPMRSSPKSRDGRSSSRNFDGSLKDALVPDQRTSAYARPSARSGMLGNLLPGNFDGVFDAVQDLEISRVDISSLSFRCHHRRSALHTNIPCA